MVKSSILAEFLHLMEFGSNYCFIAEGMALENSLKMYKNGYNDKDFEVKVTNVM